MIRQPPKYTRIDTLFPYMDPRPIYILRKDYAEANLGSVQKAIDAGKLNPSSSTDQASLKAAGLVRGGKNGVRLLAKGEFTDKGGFAVAVASRAAVEAVETAGGTVELLAAKTAAPQEAMPSLSLLAP